jgi:hypothetical protein
VHDARRGVVLIAPHGQTDHRHTCDGTWAPGARGHLDGSGRGHTNLLITIRNVIELAGAARILLAADGYPRR